MTRQIWLAFQEAVEMIFNSVYTPTVVYFNGLKKLIKNSAITTFALLAISILFALLGIYWPLKLSVIIIGLIFIVLLITAFPILALANFAHDRVPAIRRTVQLYSAIIFWIFQVIIYFSIVPIQNAPAAIPLVLLLFASVAFGFVAYGFKLGLSPKWAMLRTMFIFCSVTFFFFFPQVHEYIKIGAEIVNEKIVMSLKAPKMIEYNPSLVFFNPVTGKAKIYYYKHSDASKIDLFDGPGYHPIFKEDLKQITPEIVKEVIKNYEAIKTVTKSTIKFEESHELPALPPFQAQVGPSPEQQVNPPEQRTTPSISTKKEEEILPKPGSNPLIQIQELGIENKGHIVLTTEIDQPISLSSKGLTCTEVSGNDCISVSGSFVPAAIGALGNYPFPNQKARAVIVKLENGRLETLGGQQKTFFLKKNEKLEIFINFPAETMSHLFSAIDISVRGDLQTVKFIEN